MKNTIILMFVLLFFSCSKKNDSEIKITKPKIGGVVQKGPFLNGTSITIFELNEDCTPTGKSFSTQIADNSGTFQLNNVSLVSQFVQVKADGYYFNELTGQNSNSPITLYALTDISNKNSVNVNILSSLEKSRIEYLLTTGLSFSVAKEQAEQEILNIFSISKTDISDFDLLDISSPGEDNAILLAISLIIQGYRTESELSDFIANINTDIRTDGVLNSVSLGSLLINDARLFNLSQIRENIENRYSNLGMTITIPNFEKYIEIFLTNSKYKITNNISYPRENNGVLNLLNDSCSFVASSEICSISAFLPKGTSLKIEYFISYLDNTMLTKSFGLYASQSWNISHTQNYYSTVLTATGTGQTVTVPAMFTGPNRSVKVDFYIYENNSTTPNRIKSVTN